MNAAQKNRRKQKPLGMFRLISIAFIESACSNQHEIMRIKNKAYKTHSSPPRRFRFQRVRKVLIAFGCSLIC
jgi:hypothetical protein